MKDYWRTKGDRGQLQRDPSRDGADSNEKRDPRYGFGARSDAIETSSREEDGEIVSRQVIKLKRLSLLGCVRQPMHQVCQEQRAGGALQQSTRTGIRSRGEGGQEGEPSFEPVHIEAAIMTAGRGCL